MRPGFRKAKGKAPRCNTCKNFGVHPEKLKGLWLCYLEERNELQVFTDMWSTTHKLLPSEYVCLLHTEGEGLSEDRVEELWEVCKDVWNKQDD